MHRRAFLTRAGAIGCSLAASPLITPVTLAAAAGSARLVVIVLRGGMDGMDVVAPYGDPDLAALRGPLGDGALDLDGFFAMHSALGPLMPLWHAGQLGFVHAVSTPYRDKRSHFDGQDMLEAGIGNFGQGLSRDGWLNRALGHVPGASPAYAVGSDALMLLKGDAPVSRWSPDNDLALSPQAIRLARLVMADDPVMADVLDQALALADADGDAVAVTGGRSEVMRMMDADQKASRSGSLVTRLAEFAGGQLKRDARIASFSINGWDTHALQTRTLPRALSQLANAILTLKDAMGGPAWSHTAVVAMTEFGRTARINGSGGTDHGTGGAMVLAGGAVRGGRVVTDWPGLAESDLYEGRDLMPTRDLRAHAGWLLRGLFGLDRLTIEKTVFPGVDLGLDPQLLL